MSDPESQPLTSAHVRRRFDRAAARFDGADFVHRRVCDGMLERIEPMTISPARILDLGAGTGSASRVLAKRYRRARVVSADLSRGMLDIARGKRSRFARIREVQADARALPFADDAFDLVFANLLLPWLGEPGASLAEIGRVLRPEGLFAFSSLGPDSLAVLADAWGAVDDEPHVHPFADMHNVGDAIVRAGLRDPVLDIDSLAITYRDPDALLADLTASGARNALAARRPTLTGRRRFAAFRRALAERTEDGVITLGLELVFGHAFGGQARPAPGEFAVSPGAIGRRRPGARSD